MQDIRKQITELHAAVAAGLQKVASPEIMTRLQALQEQMTQPDFWQDAQAAAQATKQEAKLRATIEPWRQLHKHLAELDELASLNDESIKNELQAQLQALQTEFDSLKTQLQLSGPYDDHDIILRLHAGAGGTDAQDWTEMLQRMYLRWAEKSGMKAEVLEQSAGEEAGLKSATISISGPYAYGKLRSEHGVHRLVRLSPFNADNLRQTSFALVETLPQIDEPDEVQIDEKDLKIDVFRAGGHGGQSVNTTDSAVRVTHLPTNITVSIQNERSQLQNRETALKVLRSKLAQLQTEQHKQQVSELKGPSQSAEWGNQIRNYVLHPYMLVKDTRTKHEERDAQGVLDGKLDGFIQAYLEIPG